MTDHVLDEDDIKSGVLEGEWAGLNRLERGLAFQPLGCGRLDRPLDQIGADIDTRDMACTIGIGQHDRSTADATAQIEDMTPRKVDTFEKDRHLVGPAG